MDTNLKNTALHTLKAMLAASVSVCILAACSKPAQSSDSKQEKSEEAEKAAEVLSEIYESRVFDESLDMSAHPGLLSADEVTGPFLCVHDASGSRFIPDLIQEDIVDNPKLPADAEFVPEEEDFFPQEYLSRLQIPEKTAEVEAGKRQAVFALLEYMGYRVSTRYTDDTILYYHVTRVSFYSMETGEMIGWMTTSKHRLGPVFLRSEEQYSDGQHLISPFDDGSIWSDTAWSIALDELVQDENS